MILVRRSKSMSIIIHDRRLSFDERGLEPRYVDKLGEIAGRSTKASGLSRDTKDGCWAATKLYVPTSIKITLFCVELLLHTYGVESRTVVQTGCSDQTFEPKKEAKLNTQNINAL